MPDAAREFNIFLPQICGGQCGPRSLKVLHAYKRRTDLYAGEIQEEEMQSSFRSEKWSSAAEERLLLGKIEEVLEEVTEGANAERDRMVFWIYYRQGLTASAIAAIPH